MSPLLRSKTVWIACIAAWAALALFVCARDLIMIGPAAPGLALVELVPFIESMALWALISPFIIVLAARLPLDRRNWLRSLVVHAIWALAICWGDVLFDAIFAAVVAIPVKSLLEEFYEQVFINTFSYAAVAAAGYAVVYARALALDRVRSAELERQLVQAQLEALTRRLQPHFLFNALNSIAALIRLADTEKALAALVALSDLLRVVLATGGDARIPLAKELEWAERYLRIERLRFENRLRTEVHVDPQLSQALVPALVLQPFVENAIRHGVEQRSGSGVVSIAAERDGDYLAMTVRNAADQPAQQPDRPGFGLGLESTRERLAHLYGSERFGLHIDTLGNETTARIRIPWAVAAS
jgi:two-component system, LytTR family, sensor kinase